MAYSARWGAEMEECRMRDVGLARRNSRRDPRARQLTYYYSITARAYATAANGVVGQVKTVIGAVVDVSLVGSIRTFLCSLLAIL